MGLESSKQIISLVQTNHKISLKKLIKELKKRSKTCEVGKNSVMLVKLINNNFKIFKRLDLTYLKTIIVLSNYDVN